jgi:hypothetical protein
MFFFFLNYTQIRTAMELILCVFYRSIINNRFRWLEGWFSRWIRFNFKIWDDKKWHVFDLLVALLWMVLSISNAIISRLWALFKLQLCKICFNTFGRFLTQWLQLDTLHHSTLLSRCFSLVVTFECEDNKCNR